MDADIRIDDCSGVHPRHKGTIPLQLPKLSQPGKIGIWIGGDDAIAPELGNGSKLLTDNDAARTRRIQKLLVLGVAQETYLVGQRRLKRCYAFYFKAGCAKTLTAQFFNNGTEQHHATPCARPIG